MTFLPVIVSSPTCTVVGEVSRPSPSMVVMPRALSRPWRPLCLLDTIDSRYFVTPGMSMPSRVAFTPNVSESRAASAISAACSIAFVGMHPTCRHVPPTLFFSMRPTLMPSWLARSAAA